MKHIIFIVILALLAFLLLTYCDDKDYEIKGNPIKHPVNITKIKWIGHWNGEGDKEFLISKINREFNFKYNYDSIESKLYNPDSVCKKIEGKDAREIEVDFIIEQIQKPVADYDILRIKEHYNSIAAKLNDPDWGSKYLVNFDSVPGFKSSHLDILPMMRKKTGNICTGPYLEGQYWAVYVNTKVAKLMGIDTVKQYNMTFDDFLGYIKIATEYNKTHDYIVPIFESCNWISTDAIFSRLFYSLQDNLNEDNNPQKLKDLEQCYKAFEELSKYHPLPKNRSELRWGANVDFPLKDKCLFYIGGSWMYNIWKNKNSTKLADIIPCELPVFKYSNKYIGGYTSNFCIPKNSAHVKEAVTLLMLLTRSDVAEEWTRITKCPSGVIGSFSSSSFGASKEPFTSFTFNIESKYRTNKIALTDTYYILGKYNTSVSLNSIDVLEGKITAKEAINLIKSKIK